MKDNILIKILCSIPVILVLLYYIPFLGICLILLRTFIYINKKVIKLPITLLVCGILIYIPKIVEFGLKTFKLKNTTVPYLSTILSSNIYDKLLGYGKLLIIVGIVFEVLSYIFKNVAEKVGTKLENGIRDYVTKDIEKDAEIRQENDLKMQEKREKAKNTHVVRCPHCGSNNMLTEQTGICQFCRRPLEYVEKRTK